jgi:hypothetical protein
MRRNVQAVLFLCLACGGETLDVGQTKPAVSATPAGSGGSSGRPPGPVLADWPEPTDCVSASDLDVVGVWEGAIQDPSFNTVVPLELTINGASESRGVCGTVRWGEGVAPEPITDPNRGWPDDDRLGRGGGAGFLHEGATYTLLDGAVRGRQLRFTITASELWREWCALQQPYWNRNIEEYRCLPPTSGDSDNPCLVTLDDGTKVPRDEGQCGLCESPICVCNETECKANVGEVQPSVRFNLAFGTEQAIGSISGYNPGGSDVLLTRARQD